MARWMPVEIRVKALELALDAEKAKIPAAGATSGERVIARAERYLAFLRGANPRKRVSRRKAR